MYVYYPPFCEITGETSAIDVNDINNVFGSIKRTNLETFPTENLYSTSIPISEIGNSGSTIESLPYITSNISYNNVTYTNVGNELVETVRFPDDYHNFRKSWVATYVHISDSPTLNFYPLTYHKDDGGIFDSMGQINETTYCFSVATSVTTEVGVGAEEFGVKAAAGITSYLGTSFGYGSGTATTITYEFDQDALVDGNKYCIETYTYTLDFITIAYEAEYGISYFCGIHMPWAILSYYWKDYNEYAFKTNAISLTYYDFYEY